MTKLSVNINKIATLRNARGGNAPNLLKVASDIESFGAQGITIHPRPDERHIRNPNAKFIDLVLETKPTQVTWYQTPLTAITSNAGWDTIRHQAFLKDTGAQIGIELYTESYAKSYGEGNLLGINSFVDAAKIANTLGLGINAGHDLSLENIKYFKDNVPNLLEVSIGHALICESLYLGLENVVKMYLDKLK
ncbi:Pyridoxine 5'-phosphate synthase [Nymphon striatum]|nr:Pyridoxine 5'-phosphate synthase [Nymphon striatum]